MIESVLDVDGATFAHLPGQTVAGPLSFSLARGEVVALVGPSGCGKTTILKSISAEMLPCAGTITVNGLPRDRQWMASHTARTLQSFPLFHWLTVEENLRLAARLRRAPTLDVDRVLREFSALHLKTRYPHGLSGGERCRASLAQAAVIEPVLLLLDEPFSGLDLHVKEEIAERLFAFAANHGTAILLVTHDLHDACAYANRILVLGGRPSVLVASLDPSEPDAVQRLRRVLLEYRSGRVS